MKRIVFICTCIYYSLPITLGGQTSTLDFVQSEYEILERLHSKGVIDISHLSSRTFFLKDISELEFMSENASSIDVTDWNKLMNNIPDRAHFNQDTVALEAESRKGWLNTFYKDPYSFYKVSTKDFFLKIDPVIQISGGPDLQESQLIFQNTRGLKIRGIIDQKVYFYTSIFENQQRFLNYVENEIERISAIPGQGFYKPYQSGVFKGLNGWDFLNAQSYAGIRVSKSIDFRIGHGNHFIGNGTRSLLLSNYAHNYFYLQLNTKIWKIHYQNTFAELSAFSTKVNAGNTLVPKKYMATHYLNYQASPKFSIGLFESVIFSRENNFELQYLNPVILYRSVEQFLDSPDNVLMGINFRYLPIEKWQVYGQLILDELKTSEAFAGNGWWGNKVGYQIGIKAFDFLKISNLDVKLEHNTARPFTYAHRSQQVDEIPTTSYSHASQPLAHPYGANFRETLFQVLYRPHSKIYLTTNMLLSRFGDDNPDNVGRNILLSYEDRSSDYDHFTGQGRNNSIFSLETNMTYELFPNYFIDLTWLYRKQDIQDSPAVNSNYIGVGIRANMARRNYNF